MIENVIGLHIEFTAEAFGIHLHAAHSAEHIAAFAAANHLDLWAAAASRLFRFAEAEAPTQAAPYIPTPCAASAVAPDALRPIVADRVAVVIKTCGDVVRR